MITDFGLAGLAEHVQGDVRSGTPAYMAPEQLAGLEVTHKSDIYALGLVLYEMFSGKRAFTGKLRDELAPISGLVKELDPAIEKAISRCLAAEPSRRPSNPLTVAAAMPGGDPLAAALAAGETPSPEMVAAAGGNEGLRPVHALVLIAVVVAGWLAAALNGRTSLLDKIPFAYPPQVLEYKAREILTQLGYPDKPFDEVSFFLFDPRYVNSLDSEFQGKTWSMLGQLRPAPLRFHYRTSPKALARMERSEPFPDAFDPPMNVPGMTRVTTDPEGRLQYLLVVPKDTDKARAKPFDWMEYFRLAQLDFTKFSPSDPRVLPPASFDQRAAWTGKLRRDDRHTIRVEAAAFQGAPVYFEITIDGQAQPAEVVNETRSAWFALLIVIPCITLLPGWLAYRNWNSGRGDRTGAFHLAVFLCLLRIVSYFSFAHYSTPSALARDIPYWLAFSVFTSLIYGIMYFALEPHVRRHGPEMLSSWRRAISGRLGDSLVGRDVLFGLVMGAACYVLQGISHAVQSEQHFFLKVPELLALKGLRQQAGLMVMAVFSGVGMASILLLVFTGLRQVLRSRWIVVAVATGVAGASALLVGNSSWPGALATCATVAILAVSLLRFGYLTVIAGLVCFQVNEHFPPDLHFSEWYWGSNTIPLFILAGLLAWGYRAATSGTGIPGEDRMS